MTPAALRALAALLTESSPTRAAGFDTYAARHAGAPLGVLESATDRRLAEVAAAIGAHRTEVLFLHAAWVSRTLRDHEGCVATLSVAGGTIVESYVARVMAERAGLLEARPATLALVAAPVALAEAA